MCRRRANIASLDTAVTRPLKERVSAYSSSFYHKPRLSPVENEKERITVVRRHYASFHPVAECLCSGLTQTLLGEILGELWRKYSN